MKCKSSQSQKIAISKHSERFLHEIRDIDATGENLLHQKKYSFMDELSKHSLSHALGLICSDNTEILAKKSFPHCSVRPSVFSPTINRYVIANPLHFFKDKQLLDAFGINLEEIEAQFVSQGKLSILAKFLPVVYIANVHSEFGWLGFQLNLRRAGETVEELFPYLKVIRDQPLYRGGAKMQGSAWYMLHRRKDFPENRAFKKLPKTEVAKSPAFDNDAFAIFYSPAVAYANELCMSGDAQPEEFKFFAWSTIWRPQQLENEVRDKKWIVVEGPADILFAQDPNGDEPPLYQRVLWSLPRKQQ
jgi:putative AlgH/UPF0301 family transcriptional regulator